MELERKIEEMITPSLEAMGYEVVRVKFFDGKKHARLQIMAEPLGQREMNVDDCAEISHTVSALLDVEDPIDKAYDLEVSSPGIDRPLVREKDFDRYAGYDIKLNTRLAIDGRRRYKGQLLGLENGVVRMRLPEGGEVEIALDNVASAQLILTDELMAEHLRQKKKQLT